MTLTTCYSMGSTGVESSINMTTLSAII
jgi:hypothetical protein